MSDYFEINVALNGRHYFATAPGSVSYREQAERLVQDFKMRFPADQGFTITCTKWESRGTSVEF